MSADSTMCHIYAMNRNGEWFAWTGIDWANASPRPLPQMEAIYKAQYAMAEVPWAWGVKVVVLEESE